MAEYIEVCTKDVHIPSCGESRCSAHLKKVAELLKKKGCSCVDEYKMSGLWKERYMENFMESCYTIIHTCHSLWKLMSEVPCAYLTSDNYNKIICVKVMNHRTSEKRKSNLDESNEFFKQFQIKDISDSKNLTDFVQKFMQLLDNIPKSPASHQSGHGEQGHTGYINSSDSDREVFKLLHRQLASDVSRTESRQVVSVYPDEFGQTDGSEVYATTELPDDLSAKLVQLTSIADLKQHIDKFKDTPQSQTSLGNLLVVVLHKILPALYEVRDSVGLASIVLCNQPVLQNRALTKLELLVLQGFIATDICKLQETELLLARSLNEMSLKNKKVSSGQTALLLTMDRLCNLILMLHCQIIAHSSDESSESDSFNEALRQILSEIPSMNKLAVLVKSSKSLRAKAERFRDFDEFQAKELSKENVSTQIFVIFSCLMKIFARLDLQYLTFLRKYLRARWPISQVPSVCLGLISRGMIFFLSYSLRDAVHMDIDPVCSEVLNVIRKAYGYESCDEVNKILHTLLFIKIPPIRQGVIDFLKRRKLYGDKKLPHLLLDGIKNLLCPLLVLDPKDKLQTEAQWWTVLGTFGHQKVIVLFHKPTEKDHWERNTTRFIYHEDTMHQNQIMKLKTLRHPLIIQLLAYQLSNIPQFYILEDYRNKNLQTALKNRNNNKRFFKRCTLIKFLCDAAEALEFCHRAGIVHRNLTAASFFITEDEKLVKLGGFELAVKIDCEVDKIVENGKTAVPTRWSAPESLRRLKFSKASDIWMFGHFEYEMLTHGVLPYSDLDLDDDVLVQKFFLDTSYSSPVQLFPETCLKKEHYDMILTCADIDSSERPDISAVREQLHTFYNQSTSRDGNPSYPSLTDGKRQPSTAMKRGIPDVFSNNMRRSLDLVKSITSMLTQYQLDDAFIFREVTERHISQTLLSKIKTGSLDNIIPWINYNTVNSRISVFDCYIPASCGFCLLDQTIEKALGSSLENYMEVLLEVAMLLKKLHDESIVIGDMCASTLFLEQRCQDVKIFVASLAYISESNSCRQPPTNRDVCQRAAPEVKHHGLYSPASDVFGFGHLIKEVVTAFDYHLTEESPMDRNRTKTLEINDPKQRLKKLMGMCSTADMNKRPKMEKVIEAIKRFNTDLSDENHGYASPESVSSLGLSEAKGIDMASTRNKSKAECGSHSNMSSNIFEPDRPKTTHFEKSDKYNKYISINRNTDVKTLECSFDQGHHSYICPVSTVLSTNDSIEQFKSNSAKNTCYEEDDKYNNGHNSSNTALKTLDSSSNTAVKTLDSSSNTAVKTLDSSSNTAVKTLDSSSNTAVKTLNSSSNTAVKTLDSSSNTAVKTLDSSSNTAVKTLDSSSNTAVKTLERSYNHSKCQPVNTLSDTDTSQTHGSTRQHDDDNSITVLKKPACNDQLVVHGQSDDKSILQQKLCEDYNNDSITVLKKLTNYGSETEGPREKKSMNQHKFFSDYDSLQFDNDVYDSCKYANFNDNTSNKVTDPQLIKAIVFEIDI